MEGGIEYFINVETREVRKETPFPQQGDREAQRRPPASAIMPGTGSLLYNQDEQDEFLRGMAWFDSAVQAEKERN